MNILINSAHPLISDQLAKINPAGSLHYYSLDYDFFPNSDIKTYDLIIVQGLRDLPVALNRLKSLDIKNIPVIVIEHTLPYPIPTEEHARVSNYATIPQIKKVVFLTSEQVNRWRLPGEKHCVIPPAIDIAKFPIWEGNEEVVITACNEIGKRDWSCGYNFWNQLTSGMPKKLYGHGNEGLAGAAGPVAHETLIKQMAAAGLWANTALHSTLPTTLLEALAIGMPVFSTATYTPMVLRQKFGAELYLSNCLGAMRLKINETLSNYAAFKDEFISSGSRERSRKAIHLAFNPDRFETEWKLLLEQVIC